MSTSLSLVTSDNRQWGVSRPAATVLQSILEDACSHFSLDATTYRLEQRDARGNSKPIDHTLSIRMAQLPPNSQLHIAQCRNLSPNVHLTLSLPSQQPATVNAVFPVTSTLRSVLSHFHALHPTLRVSSYSGVPPPEHNERFSLTINVPGTMQTVIDTGCKRVVGDEALAATTLAQLGLKGEEGGRAGKGRLKLTHDYQRPAMDETEQAAVMQRFSSTLHNSVQEVEQKRKERADEKKRQQDEEAAVVIPADRNLRVLQAQPGLLPAPDLPDSFYEVSEEDSVEYARSVMRQAAKERGEPTPPAAATAASADARSNTPTATPAPAQRKRPLMSLVRIKLPHHTYVEGVFKASERVSEVREWLLARFIRQDMRASVGPLFVTPPKRPLDTRKTLREEGLLGSVLIHATINGRHDAQGVRRGRETVRAEESKEGEEKKDGGDEEVKEEKQAPPPQAAATVADVVHAEWLPEEFLSASALSAMQTIRPASEQAPASNQPVAGNGVPSTVAQPVT